MAGLSNVRLNHYDDEGNVVDGDFMPLSIDQVSNIVDQAAQLIIACRQLLEGGKSQSVNVVLSELQNALADAGVISEDDNLPWLVQEISE